MKEVFKNQRILRQLLINIERKVTNAVIHAEEQSSGHSDLGGLAGDP